MQIKEILQRIIEELIKGSQQTEDISSDEYTLSMHINKHRRYLNVVRKTNDSPFDLPLYSLDLNTLQVTQYSKIKHGLSSDLLNKIYIVFNYE